MNLFQNFNYLFYFKYLYKKFINVFLVFIVISFTYTDIYSDNTDSIKLLINSTVDNKKLLKLYEIITKIYIVNNDTTAVLYAKKQKSLAEKAGSDFDIANSYKSMGLALRLKDDIYLAADYFIKEKIIRENISDKYGLAYAYKNLGESYRSFFEYDKSLENLNQALTLFKELNEPKGIAITLNRIGAVYGEYFDYERRKKSLNIILESNKIAEKINDLDLQLSNFLLIGANYTALGDYRKGLENLFTSVTLCDRLKDKSLKSLILKNIATNYYQIHDYENAIKYGREAYFESLKSNIRVYKWLSTSLLSISFDETHQIDSAYKYLTISANLRNQLYDEEKEKALYKIEAKYQKEKFERDIENQKKERNFINIIYSISIISILIILGLSILRYKNLRKTHERLYNQNLIIENQKEELTKLNATKDKFFSIIAHDLRNPLGNFMNMTELLSTNYNEMTETSRLEFLDLMKESSKNIYLLLDNLLEWSRSQRGILPFNPFEFDILRIVNDTIELLQISIESKNIRIENNIVSSFILADPNMIKTVIRNLISNSIKFSPENGIISINSAETDGFVQISVKDSGIGISQDIIEKLFRIDQNVTTLGTSKEKGTGLGLILSREFIEKHGGKIWVESEVGKGSTFSFTIPKNK
jgi:signal transduction histidine kinase